MLKLNIMETLVIEIIKLFAVTKTNTYNEKQIYVSCYFNNNYNFT